MSADSGRGRDTGHPAPPAQTRAGATNAHGSYLGCWRQTASLAGDSPSFFTACRTRSSPFDSLSRLGVRHESGCTMFSLVSGLSSTASCGPPKAFVRLLRWYYAAVRLPAAVHLGLIAHRLHPTVRVLLTTDGHGASRFSRVKFLCMHGVFDSAGPRRTRATARRHVAFRLA